MHTNHASMAVHSVLGLLLLTSACSDNAAMVRRDGGNDVSAPVNEAKDTGPATRDALGTDTFAGPPYTVTFHDGRPQGALTGSSMLIMDPQATVASPVCAQWEKTETKQSCMGPLAWSSPDALCVSATLPTSPRPSTTVSGYYHLVPTYSWGLRLGIAAEDPKTGFGVAFSRITIRSSGNSQGMKPRVLVHRSGDPNDAYYCQQDTGAPLWLKNFNTKCWGDPTTVAFPADDARRIDRIELQFPSSSATYSIAEYCWQGLTLD